jgi:hypothetical protein
MLQYLVLEITHNPRNAWETHAPRRVFTIAKKTSIKQKLRPSILWKKKRHINYPVITNSLTISCLHRSTSSMARSSRNNNRLPDSPPPAGEIVMADTSPTNKRTTPDNGKSAQKKAKSHPIPISIQRDHSLLEFWYGFPVMENLAYEANLPPLITRASVQKLVTQGYTTSEAEERRTAKMSFPRVMQKLWPINRPDFAAGQHINLTQLPSDIEVHSATHLSLDYQVLLHFEKPSTPFTQDQIMKKVLLRLSSMNILLGDQIREPVAILCHGPKNIRVWSGMVKLHLKNPELDGLALLHGTRVFVISLDDDIPHIAKIAKSYDPLASSSMLSVKINSETIRDLDAHQLLKTVVESSFTRGHDYEITQAQKTAGETYGWLVTTSPEQLERIDKNRIPVLGELLQPITNKGDQLSREDIIKRNCLVLIAKGLNLTKPMEATTEVLKTHLGPKNVASIFYPRQKGSTHSGIANVECLNSAVYKQNLRKSIRLQGKWVEFQPHPNSLDGSAKPDNETLRQYGFMDVNNAIANTVEALQNAPGLNKKQLTKEDITTLVKDVVSEENGKLRTEFQADMTTLKTTISSEAQNYADRINFELRCALTNLEQVLVQSMQVVKNLARPSLPALEELSSPQSKTI